MLTNHAVGFYSGRRPAADIVGTAMRRVVISYALRLNVQTGADIPRRADV